MVDKTLGGKSVGIDLGTTYSCVGVWQNNGVEIIANEWGNRKTPSYVAFTDTEILVGDAAKSQISTNPYNTIFDVSRLIGHDFSDSEVQSNMKYWPFRIIERNGRPYIRVRYRGEKKDFAPEEILSMILAKMKEIAETFLGTLVHDAVITVPVYFNNSQCRAIMDAGLISGLNVRHIIGAPISAAVAFEFNKKTFEETNVIVFDLGGGTCDVSILTIEERIVEVKAVAGHNHLGGEDFDNRLVDHFVQKFNSRFRRDLTSNMRDFCRLRKQCERAKRVLSTTSQSSEIDPLVEGVDFYISLTRSIFEELNHDLFRSILEPVERVLRDSKIDKSQVHEILLIGGSTRIPKIQKTISEFFKGKEPNRSVNPDEAATCGAAIQAAMLSGDASEIAQDFLLLDVTPFSLGIDGVAVPVINRNTTIPVKRSEILSTDFDNQSSVFIQIYEGNNTPISDNNLLGEFELEILPAPRGVPEIEVTFDVDKNRILNISAVDKSFGRQRKIAITNNDRRGLSNEEIKRMIAEARKYRVDGEEASLNKEARNDLESYIYDLRNTVQDIINMKNKLENAIQESIAWLESNQEAEMDECEHKKKFLEDIANPILKKIYGTFR